MQYNALLLLLVCKLVASRGVAVPEWSPYFGSNLQPAPTIITTPLVLRQNRRADATNSQNAEQLSAAMSALESALSVLGSIATPSSSSSTSTSTRWRTTTETWPTSALKDWKTVGPTSMPTVSTTPSDTCGEGTLEKDKSYRTSYYTCQGINRPGGDINTYYNVDDHFTCLQKCSDHPFCVGVTYDSIRRTCAIKSKLNPPVPASDGWSTSERRDPLPPSCDVSSEVTSDGRRYVACWNFRPIGGNIFLQRPSESPEDCIDFCTGYKDSHGSRLCIGFHLDSGFSCSFFATGPTSYEPADMTSMIVFVVETDENLTTTPPGGSSG